MKKLFLLCACFLISSCGGAGGPSERDVELMIERLAVTNSVEEVVENGIDHVLNGAAPVFYAYIEVYDSSPGPIPISLSGESEDITFSADLNYEKQAANVYYIDITINSIVFVGASAEAWVTSDMSYDNTVTNSVSAPVTGRVQGTVDVASGIFDFTATGSGTDFVVEGERPGSVSIFTFYGVYAGSVSGDSSYTCRSDSQMTLTLSSGEEVTCNLSEDCQRCN